MLHFQPTIAERMADALISMDAAGLNDHQTDRLIEVYGFTGSDIASHRDEAVRLARKRTERQVEDTPPTYEREFRRQTARAVLLAIVPDEGALHARLRRAGLMPAEIAEFWPELIDLGIAKVQTLRCPS